MSDSTEVRLARSWYAEGRDALWLRNQVRADELQRVRHGAYAASLELEPRLRHRQLLQATVPRLNSDAVLSHASAAVLHDLPIWADELGLVHITRATALGSRRSRNLHVHPGPLASEDVTVIDGYHVTGLARTVADLGRTSVLGRAVAVSDAGLRLGLPREWLVEQADRALNRTGAGQLHFVVGFADGRAESPGESRSRLVLHQLRLPPPVLQYEVIDPATSEVLARCDFGWEEHRTVGEFDGRVKYGKLLRADRDPGDVVYAEKVREDLVRDQGHQMVRWITEDLDRPSTLRARILRAFARNARRS